jgi:tripartite-type tricarboxylate transporter receptor subunit TctC
MKLPHRRKFLHLVAGAAALPAVSRFAWAQTYPSRPVRIVVGFPPGGGADSVTRIVASGLSDRLGQSVIVENRPGATTNVSVQAVVNAPPDGYTLLYLGASAVTSSHLFNNLPFNLLRDIVPVAALIDFPQVLEVNPSVEAKSLAELIALAKAKPGAITMASYGTGSASHLAGELLKMMADINLVHVPYRGGAPMVTDLVGGQVQVGIDVMPSSLPQIQAGRLRALAVTGKTRFSALPAVPSISETITGYDADTWGGIGLPRGTPVAVVQRLNREINAVLSDPTVKAKLLEIGTVPRVLTPSEFGAFVAAEHEKFGKIIRFANIKPE